MTDLYDLYSVGVQMFFLGGKNYLVCNVFVGYNESPTGYKWYECGNLHYINQTTPYRDVLIEDGNWYKATYDEHFKGWLVDQTKPTSNPWETNW